MRKGPESAYDKWNISLDIYSATVNQVMVTIVKRSMSLLQLNQ
jgi:hypothetical protein